MLRRGGVTFSVRSRAPIRIRSGSPRHRTSRPRHPLKPRMETSCLIATPAASRMSRCIDGGTTLRMYSRSASLSANGWASIFAQAPSTSCAPTARTTSQVAPQVISTQVPAFESIRYCRATRATKTVSRLNARPVDGRHVPSSLSHVGNVERFLRDIHLPPERNIQEKPKLCVSSLLEESVDSFLAEKTCFSRKTRSSPGHLNGQGTTHRPARQTPA